MHAHFLIMKLHTDHLIHCQHPLQNVYSPFYSHGCHSETGYHEGCVINPPDTLTQPVSPQPNIYYSV